MFYSVCQPLCQLLFIGLRGETVEAALNFQQSVWECFLNGDGSLH